jgi:spore coat polysaccharide biosynthesis protein SpsF
MGFISDSKYGVIIQARTGSSRLPGKVLMDVEGQPMLLRQLRRLQHGLKVPKLVVATTEDPSDKPVEELCRDNGFECFRGPRDDVMNRFILSAQGYDISYIIRVGGDDPLIDWECCNTLIDIHREKLYDFMYASNRDGWPYGCAAELIDRGVLEQIHTATTNSSYLEHTIPYFLDHPEEFQILKVKGPKELNRPDYYFTVDYPEDIKLIREIFKRLKDEGDYFPLRRAIELIDENPEIININRHLHRGFER